MFSLGNVYLSQAETIQADGRCDEAIAVFEESEKAHLQALKLFQATLGERHHRVGDAWYKLACHMHRRRDYSRALCDSLCSPMFTLRHVLTNGSRIMLGTALGIYERSRLFRNETARSIFKYGCVLQDAGRYVEGRKQILEAEKMRCRALGTNCTPTTSEADYDDLVMFWSR